MSKLDYILDENVSKKTLKRLRKKNISILSVRSENLLSIQNGDLINLCKEKNWVSITHDKDFLTPSIKGFLWIYFGKYS